MTPIPYQFHKESVIDRLKSVLPDPRGLINPQANKGSGEIAGPCPKCGGEDRFFIREDDSFMCRQCGAQGGDVIDFYKWLDDTDFNGLVKRYLNDSRPTVTPMPSPLPTAKNQAHHREKKAKGIKARAIPQNLTQAYTYRDEAGIELFRVHRYEEPDKEKTFRQGTMDASGNFQFGIDGVRRVLYRLPEVVKVEKVFLVEGEKCADCLAEQGATATTSPMGAGNWRSDLYAKQLEGKDVIILPDSDDPGRNYAEDAASSLHGVARSVKVVPLPDLPEHGDIADWLDISYTLEHLEELIAQAPDYKPQAEDNDADQQPGSTEDFAATVIAATRLSTIEYERRRKEIADKLNVRVSWLDEQRKQSQREEESAVSDDVVLEDEPWDEPVDGDQLMADIVDQINRHVVLPDGAADPIGLWTLLTYCYDQFRILPILGIVSPQKRCGKTTLLEIISGITNRSLMASNISSAAVFRTIEKFRPTLLVDEADSFLKDNEELRGVINSGHTRSSAFVIRCDGEDNDPRKFSTWGPKAIAAIGKLPGTIADRAIIIKLRRKTTSECREKIREKFDSHAAVLRRNCHRWAIDNADELRGCKAEITISGNDRGTDNWRPLAAIAATVGGDWLNRLTKAAIGMTSAGDDDADDLSILLLEDIKDAFESIGTDRIFSSNIVNFLNNLDERPWQDFKGRSGLTTNGFSMFLKPFGIKSKDIRIGPDVKKGYMRSFFDDAFHRYLPAKGAVQSATPQQSNNSNKLGNFKEATKKDVLRFKKGINYKKSLDCCGVALQKEGPVEGIEKNNLDDQDAGTWRVEI